MKPKTNITSRVRELAVMNRYDLLALRASDKLAGEGSDVLIAASEVAWIKGNVSNAKLLESVGRRVRRLEAKREGNF